MSERRTGSLARIALLALWSLVPRAAAGEPEPSLRSLYESKRWFELRDRVASGKTPVFYRAAVAAAFHIGLPVLLGLRAIRWDRGGKFRIHSGSPRPDLRRSNLFFDGAMPVVRADFGRGEIAMQLDTGAVHTDLWPRFGRDFAAVVAASGERGSRRVTGIGSSVEAGAIVLPEVTLRIGGFDAVLRPASVLQEPMGQGGDDYHGRLGMDLLGQARRVDLDFRAMTLKLE